MNDAEAVQSLLDLARGHGRAVVGHQRPRHPALHQRLAQPVDEGLGGLGQVPLQVAAQARVVVEEAEQDGRAPLAGGGQHPALAVMEVSVRCYVQHLTLYVAVAYMLCRGGLVPADKVTRQASAT